MKVDLKLGSEYTEPLAVIYASEITDEVADAVKKLKETGSDIITGFSDDRAEIISPDCLPLRKKERSDSECVCIRLRKN